MLNALDATDVPHCSVQWSGDDLEWFDCPYFVVPWLSGDVLRLGEGEWGRSLSGDQLLELGRQAMTALAGVHKVDPANAAYLGDPVPFEEDVTRWDRFHERAAEPERLARAPEVRRKLLERIPTDAPVDLGWFRALAAYKFAIISGFNLSLHRRGKRHDPVWETTALAMEPLIDRALDLLG